MTKIQTGLTEFPKADLTDLPEVGTIYHPSITTKGRKPMARQVISSTEKKIVYASIVDNLEKRGPDTTINTITFRDWARRNNVRIEKKIPEVKLDNTQQKETQEEQEVEVLESNKSQNLQYCLSTNNTVSTLLRQDDAVMVFIDGANHELTMSALAEARYVYSRHALDYKKLYKFFCQNSNLVRIHYYTGLVLDQSDANKGIQSRLNWMSYNHISVRVKKAERNGPNHIIKSNYNVDVELAVDMYRAAALNLEGRARRIDHIVLFSGDSDFCYPIELIKSLGVKVTVIGSRKVRSMSDTLVKAADEFIELFDLIEFLNFQNTTS